MDGGLCGISWLGAGTCLAELVISPVTIAEDYSYAEKLAD
jgi:hypothetical protein